MSDDANSLLQDYQELWSKQGNFRSLWNTVAQYVMPAWDNFLGEFAEGVNRNTRIFDSTGIIANERFAAAMESMLTPHHSIWMKLTAPNEQLKADPGVRKFYDYVNKILFGARYHPEANFASQTDECYMSLGAFGNDALYVDEVIGRCLRYRSQPLSEIVWAPNHQGMVDTLFRKFKYTAKQAMQHWAGATPAPVKRQYEKSPYTEGEYLHCVRPNYEWLPGSYGDRGKRYESWYLYLGTKQVIERSAFHTFPFGIGRYRMAPRENYGRGPALTCLPDIRTANEMMKTGLRAGEKACDPPILLMEESILTNFNQRPGANNYGMVSADGKPLAVPFESKARFEVQEKLLEDTRGVVRDAFLNTLFQILVQNPNMTATEALLRAQEKGELIAPAMGRQQNEFLGNIVQREVAILVEARQIPPLPDTLKRIYLQTGRWFDIEFTSPLARALKAEEGSAIMNTVSDIAQLANLDPTVRLVMDYHDAARTMADIRGCPAKVMRTEEQVQALLEQQAEQSQNAQAAAAAPQVAAGVKNLAQGALFASQAGAAAPGAPSVAQAA